MDLTQKLINDGNDAVGEMLQGVIAAHPDHLWRPEHAPRAIIAKNGPREGKVALLIGGGSGHEPTFWGLLAKGLLMDSVAWFGASQPHRLKHTN